MMKMIEIGKLGKSFGKDGEIRATISDRYLPDLLEANVFFISLNGQYVPFFLEAVEVLSDLILNVEEIETKEAAQELAGKILYMRLEDLLQLEDELEQQLGQYERYLGYLIEDQSLGPLVAIENFVEMPQQILALISYKNKTVYIPFQEQLILEIDHSNKRILMDLPEGLLDL